MRRLVAAPCASLWKKGLSPRFKTDGHPSRYGRLGALNWPEAHFVALARRLIRRYNIIVTGGPGESSLWWTGVFQGIAQSPELRPPTSLFSRSTWERGAWRRRSPLFNRCDGVVAPSTGPMHLAVALGKKVVSVFPPIKVQSAVRWGPYGVSMGTNLGNFSRRTRLRFWFPM
jgi:ADP-heptose:LPS heptosyltransferase